MTSASRTVGGKDFRIRQPLLVGKNVIPDCYGESSQQIKSEQNKLHFASLFIILDVRRIQDFPDWPGGGGSQISEFGAKTYYLASL